MASKIHRIFGMNTMQLFSYIIRQVQFRITLVVFAQDVSKGKNSLQM